MLTGEDDAVGMATGLAAGPALRSLVGLSAFAEDGRLGGSACSGGARRFAGTAWVGAGARTGTVEKL